jgi:hypothetical protein
MRVIEWGGGGYLHDHRGVQDPSGGQASGGPWCGVSSGGPGVECRVEKGVDTYMQEEDEEREGGL